MSLSLLLPTFLLTAAAIAAPDPLLPPSPQCDDTCLLKLIRYREEANVDWLMAVPFCSSFLLNPAEQRTRVQLVQVATPQPDLITTSTTTITSTLTATTTTTSTNSLFDLPASDDESDHPNTDTSPLPLPLTPRSPSPDPGPESQHEPHLAICNRYWAHYKPRPLPWHGHPPSYLRQACFRLLHRAPVLGFSEMPHQAVQDVVISVFDDMSARYSSYGQQMSAPQAPDELLVSVTVFKTVTTQVVVVEPAGVSTSTSTVTVTRTRTRTVTVTEEGAGDGEGGMEGGMETGGVVL